MRLKKVCEKIVLIIVTLSLLISFAATPASYAKLTLKDGEFYYAGTTKGTYVASVGIFSWLLDNLGQIADWLVGIMTMGFRMVFVGWTALIERLLTWALETTAGVNINGDGVDNATDLSSITDSSSNITVQAIVYNQVPVFDINFFDIKYDPTVSGTGHIYTCDRCNKPASECCSEDGTCSCEKGCNGLCDGCKSYAAALDQQDNTENVTEGEENKLPITIQLKTLVAQWYYILRILSIAAMLIVLIFVGIKMAFSTIASDKAVYKRMLVDWVAGTIILVSSHYIMWFVIEVNNSFVDVIKESANSLNQVQLKQLYDRNDEGGKGEKKEITDEEIEISVYEAIRTRAYDPKLSVGLSGMVMYMTLVYFSIRYTLVYLKRYLTMVVLTLMGPPVGVAYAFQKAVSGKSSTYKAWLTEYIMNVIIQSVHALIYAIFISTALVLSLQSVAGMIIALILMNFSLKAEKLFKQIFKMSSEGSLLESAEQAGDAEHLRANFQAARGLYMGAKPIVGALTNTPYVKALKGVGKAGVAGVGLAANTIKNTRNPRAKEKSFERAIAKEMDKNGEGSSFKRDSQGRDAETEEQYEARREKARAAVVLNKPKYRQFAQEYDGQNSEKTTKELMNIGEAGLRGNVKSALNTLSQTKEGTPEHQKAQAQLQEAMADYGAYENLRLPNNREIASAHIERVTDIHNHFQLSPNVGGSFLKGTFGTSHYDYKSGKWVSDGNAYYQQFNSKNLLGITDADKKILKEQVYTPIKMGLGGMVSTFVGLGTMVAHPKLGMAMVAGGVAAQTKAFKKPLDNTKYKGKYAFSRFSVPTMDNIQKASVARANREINALESNADEQMIQRIKNNNPDFYNALKKDINNDFKSGTFTDSLVKDLKVARNSGITAATLGFVAGAPSIVPAATVAGAGLFARTFIAHTGISSNIEAIQKHAANQAKKQQLEFIEEAERIECTTGQAIMQMKLNEIEEKNKERDREEAQKELNRKYQEQIIALYADQGFIYNPENGLLVPMTTEENERKEKLNQESFIEEIKTKDGKTKTFTENNNKLLNNTLESIIQKLGENGNIDMTSQTLQNEVISKLKNELVDAKIITEDQYVEDVIIGGKDKLIEDLKARATKKNFENTLKSLSEEEKEKIKIAVVQAANEKENDFSQVSVEDVLAKLSLNTGDNQNTTQTQNQNQNQDQNQNSNRNQDQDINQQIVQNINQQINQDTSQTQDINQNQNSNGSRNQSINQNQNPNASQTQSMNQNQNLNGIQTQSLNQNGNQTQSLKQNQMPNDNISTPDTEVIVKNYLAHIQKLQPPHPSEVSEVEKQRITNQKAKSRRKKMEQILTLQIEDDLSEETAIDSTIERLKKIEKGTSQEFTLKETINGNEKKRIKVTSEEASDVLEMLLVRKELEQINEVAGRELELKKGTKAYKNGLNNKSKAALEYYREKLEIETKMQKDPTLTYTEEKLATLNKSKRTQIKEKQTKLEKQINEVLPKKELKMKQQERELVSKGPIVNVDTVVSEMFKAKL